MLEEAVVKQCWDKLFATGRKKGIKDEKRKSVEGVSDTFQVLTYHCAIVTRR